MVIKQAFAAKILEDGQTWLNMLEERNLLSHTYNQENFQKAIINIDKHCINALGQIYELLKKGFSTMKFGLTAEELKMICDLFCTYPQITRINIFGSRALGNYKHNSDIDLTIWGKVNRALLGTISLELDNLPLPYLFDINIYDQIQHRPLQEHIDQYSQTLYVRNCSAP